jgi:hypothetical protein
LAGLPKLPNLAPQVKAILEREGWRMRIYGKSYEIWGSPNSVIPVSIDAVIVSRKTANEILKKAGLPSAF